jgi:hypothetical protein
MASAPVDMSGHALIHGTDHRYPQTLYLGLVCRDVDILSEAVLKSKARMSLTERTEVKVMIPWRIILSVDTIEIESAGSPTRDTSGASAFMTGTWEFVGTLA